MTRLALLAAVLGVSVACSTPGFTALEPDNPDSLEEIPPPPPVTPRDEVDDSPYDEPEEEEEDEPVDEPTEEPVTPDPPTPVVVTPPPPTPVVVTPPPPTPVVTPPPPTPTPPPVTPEPPFDGCPAGVVCVDSLPATEFGSTTGGQSLLDGYSCSPGTNESGPEDVYEVVLPSDGFLAISLSGLPSGVDVDVHLLSDVDANACIDRGHWDAASLLPAGTYYVAVDSWVDGSGISHDGAYTVHFEHTPYDRFPGLSSLAMQRSLTAFDTAWHDGETSSLIYTIADFTLPSTVPRQWTFSLATGELLFHEYVSHGQNSTSASNPAMVGAMSNTNGSHMSSVGLMRAAETYTGSKGYSMRLDGLEPGYNDAVRPRAIVVHSATYATASFAAANGYLGRSWGCPALDPAVNNALIDTIKNGSLFMSYFDDSSWLANSTYL